MLLFLHLNMKFIENKSNMQVNWPVDVLDMKARRAILLTAEVTPKYFKNILQLPITHILRGRRTQRKKAWYGQKRLIRKEM